MKIATAPEDKIAVGSSVVVRNPHHQCGSNRGKVGVVEAMHGTWAHVRWTPRGEPQKWECSYLMAVSIDPPKALTEAK